jgi:hypothetical protein
VTIHATEFEVEATGVKLPAAGHDALDDHLIDRTLPSADWACYCAM